MKQIRPLPNDQRATTARVEAHDALYYMRVVPQEEMHNYNTLKRLLGYSVTMNDSDFCARMTIKDVEILELLTGPHGYAIYKMLEARKRRRIIE